MTTLIDLEYQATYGGGSIIYRLPVRIGHTTGLYILINPNGAQVYDARLVLSRRGGAQVPCLPLPIMGRPSTYAHTVFFAPNYLFGGSYDQLQLNENVFLCLPATDGQPDSVRPTSGGRRSWANH